MYSRGNKVSVPTEYSKRQQVDRGFDIHDTRQFGKYRCWYSAILCPIVDLMPSCLNSWFDHTDMRWNCKIPVRPATARLVTYFITVTVPTESRSPELNYRSWCILRIPVPGLNSSWDREKYLRFLSVFFPGSRWYYGYIFNLPPPRVIMNVV